MPGDRTEVPDRCHAPEQERIEPGQGVEEGQASLEVEVQQVQMPQLRQAGEKPEVAQAAQQARVLDVQRIEGQDGVRKDLGGVVVMVEVVPPGDQLPLDVLAGISPVSGELPPGALA